MGAAIPNTLEVAGLVMGTKQNSYSAKIAAYRNELAANSLEAQAARKELEAEQAEKLGALEQMEQEIEGRRAIASKRVDYAASGVKVDSGSAAEVTADMAAWNEYDRQKIEYQTDLESWGLRYDAALLRQEAANTRAGASSSSSVSSTSQTLIGVGSKLFNTGAGKIVVDPQSAFK